MSRKTIEVEFVKNRVNEMLANSTCSPKERRAMAIVLDIILHETGNYRGFRYLQLDSQYREDWVATVNAGTLNDELRGRYFGDESRIAYL